MAEAPVAITERIWSRVLPTVDALFVLAIGVIIIGACVAIELH